MRRVLDPVRGLSSKTVFLIFSWLNLGFPQQETGRYRLVKGSGEIIEEIVTRDRHQQINKVGLSPWARRLRMELRLSLCRSRADVDRQ